MSSKSSRLFVFLFGIIAVYLLVGIPPANATTGSAVWKASDVRMVDFIDANEPFLDLIAVYTREQKGIFQIRLDYLDITSDGMQNIVLAIDNKPGGNSLIALPRGPSFITDMACDLLIFIDHNQDFIVLDHDFNIIDGVQVRLERDLVMDTVIISANSEAVRGNNSVVNIQAFSLSPDLDRLADSTVVFSSNQVAEEHAKVVLYFWNTFRSSTPAEALRSWDGAHAGPRSSRHGLRYLVEASSKTRVPVVLGNLATPANFSALDYLGVLDTVSNLVRDRLVFMNDILLGDCNYLGDNGYTQFYDAFNTSFLPGSSPEFRLSLRESLVTSAHFPETVVLIGGDFTTSEWGSPGVAQHGLEYIANHPWILTLGEVGLLPDGRLISRCNSDQKINTLMTTDLYAQLLTTSPNPLTEIAWQMCQLHAPKETLSQNNVASNGVFHVIAGAQWANNPYNKTGCTVDLDGDGNFECILANQQIFATIELEGGAMIFAFFQNETGIHQIIGPIDQFVTSDMLDQIPGVINDGEGNTVYQVDVLSPGLLTLISDDMSTRKTFKLTQDGIYLAADGTSSPMYIPLTIDPWRRFRPHWEADYFLRTVSPQNWIWGLNSGIAVDITTPNLYSFHSFNASIDAIHQPEDPNHDYAAGHYLPFPMAMIALQPSEGQVSLTIQITP